MSAFLVSKEDIDLLVSAMREHAIYIRDEGRSANELDPTKLGKMLWQENVRSMEYRYPQDDRDENAACVAAYEFTQYGPIKPAAAAKLAACYSYQSCEHDGWTASPAREAIQALYGALARKLPGYEAAPWGISDKSDIAECLA